MRINIHTFPKFLVTVFVSPLLVMICLISATSCQDDEGHLEPVPYQVLDSILSIRDITVDEVQESMIAMIGEAGLDEERVIAPYKQQIDMAILRARKYKAFTVSYHTVDPNGLPVVASGVVYYPNSGTPRGIIEAISFSKEKDKCASKRLVNLQLAIGMAGFIILVPDQIGYGSTESQPIPFFYNENTARVSADFRLAATELVRNVYGRQMPQWTLVTGISLAASEAWALARYYHTHPEMGVQVSQIWIAGGIYNPMAVLEQQLNTQYAEYAFIPNVLYSINHYDGLGLNLEEIFKGELRNHYEEWCTGYMPLTEVSTILGPDLGQYLNLDFFNEENPDYLKLKTSIERLSIPNDWIPSCPVHIYHGRNDTWVPFEASQELVNYLRSVGARVDFVVTETGHAENCIKMEIDLAEHLYK